MDDRLVLLEAELGQHAVHAVRAENPHQIVLQRQEELGAAGIALAAGAAAELVVDAPRLVPLGAQNEQAAETDDLLALALSDFLELGLLGLKGFVELGQDALKPRQVGWVAIERLGRGRLRADRVLDRKSVV